MNPLSHFYTLRSYVEAYAGFLGARFLTLIWVVAICVVVWFYGASIGYGEFKPLVPASRRIALIGAVIAGWLIYFVVSLIRARRRDKSMVDELSSDPEAEANAARAAEVGEIHNRLKEALALLRRVTKRRFGYVYELPWYVIFGAPGSGKTTALTNSGLKFPLGDALGANAVQGVGGTRHCNWWFTEDAILIDTAGRYTTQDDMSGASKAGWEGFLGLLKKYRRSQPINGVLVTLSVGDLMVRDSEAQMEEIRAIRQRLAELDEFLQARVPVYIVLTKTDLLTGFVEFFDGLPKSERDQVWGMTFGLDESYGAAALPERFLTEFQLLQERVGSMLIERLQQEPDMAVRGRIFRFPAELAAIRDQLHDVLGELCTGSKLVEPPLVRGVYLASGTQTASAAMPRAKRSYFLSRLFTDVIFGEAALVARDIRLSRRQLVLRRVAYAASAALVVLVLASWTATYFQNTNALAMAEQRLDAYERHVNGIPVRDVADADFLRVLPALNELANATSGFEDARVWPIALGLDQEAKIAGRQAEAYRRALSSLLLPRVMVHLQEELDADDRSPAQTFDALKLYGMLGGLGAVDAAFVESQAEDLFLSLYPEDGRAAARQALVAHVVAMAESPLPPISLDDRLITEARAAIAEQSLAARAFDILASGQAARALSPWSPAEALGPLGEQAFIRTSEASLRQGVPGLYTAQGYAMVIGGGLDEAARTALSEGWVRGEEPRDTGSVDVVAAAALEIYHDTFERRWNDVLNDIRVRPSQTLDQAAETTRLVAGDPSPLQSVARSIVEATDLRSPASIAATLGQETAAAAAPEAASDATALLPSMEAPDPFADLRAALTDQPQQSTDGETAGEPVSAVATLDGAVDALHEQLARATTSSAEVAEIFDVDSQLTTANQDLLQLALQMPAPLDVWMAGLAADIGSLAVKTARTTVGDLWAAEGASLCSSVVNGRYPFDRASDRDVAMSDFVRLFGPEGLFATFFDTRLAPFVDTSTSPWSWRGTFGAEGAQSDAVAQFENAATIRRAFFPNDATEPSVSINVTPVDLSDASNAVMVEIEGERVVYFHGPVQSKSITWPSAEAANLSRVAFQPGGWQRALTENGDWSPFRLFDDAEIVDESGDLFRARFALDGQSAEFDVQFGSVLNPFRLPAIAEFACPTQF